MTSLVPDPLTVVTHCRAGARMESAPRLVPANATSKTRNSSLRMLACALLPFDQAVPRGASTAIGRHWLDATNSKLTHPSATFPRDSPAALSGSADRQIVIDHMRDAFHVNAERRDIRRHQNL